jgi:hypothetical protein
MTRLAKYRADRQQELFARADIPVHTPGIDHYAAVDRRRVQHQPRAVLWEGMASWVRQMASFPESWRRSADQDERFRKTVRMLDIEKVRLCRHDDALELVEERLADWRNNDLRAAFTRSEIGTLLVEVRNRRHLLALGRHQAKPKGPRMDPAMMPMEAIDRLIQRHPNIVVVEQLRIERARRIIAAASA